MKQVKETKTIIVERWEASNGKRFDSSDECMVYEKTLDKAFECVKNIESKCCYAPFSDWDMDVEQSTLYLLKNEQEYESLASVYAQNWMCDTDYWDVPKSYPTVFYVISRECYTRGYEIDWAVLSDFMEVMQSMNEYLCNKEQYKK